MRYEFSGLQAATLKILLADMGFEYQRRWFISQKRVRHITKTRQCGADWYFSLEALIDAIETGRSQYFIAPGEGNSLSNNRLWMAHIARLAGVDIAPDDSVIYLTNGAEIQFMGEQHTLAARNGNAYISEYAWADKPANMFKVAKGISAHKNCRFTAYTSPSPSDEAYALWSSEKPDNQQRLSAYSALQQGSTILNLPDIEAEFSKEDFNMLFSAIWPQENSEVAK
ncbi:terminase family protein [Klebsiella electrica]|uniref:terminase large subunit domain-containing protein n=1 Tax=Klebsiella electrica TaxID=1259973 RepID=UPI00255256DF|nr:terminase family protein [Klebsiella electrica]WIO42651.1 terminase family protein [Klebsiella electrica]